jgi:carbonic anhydrase
MARPSKAQSCLRTPKLPNEPNLKMTFPAKKLAISHFHPFSERVKNGKKVSISCHFLVKKSLTGFARRTTA